MSIRMGRRKYLEGQSEAQDECHQIQRSKEEHFQCQVLSRERSDGVLAQAHNWAGWLLGVEALQLEEVSEVRWEWHEQPLMELIQVLLELFGNKLPQGTEAQVRSPETGRNGIVSSAFLHSHWIAHYCYPFGILLLFLLIYKKGIRCQLFTKSARAKMKQSSVLPSTAMRCLHEKFLILSP